MTYFDTAYLVKCYVKEVGWEKVRELARQEGKVACSSYGRIELHAALHRKLREGEVSREQMNVVLRQLELDDSQRLWSWLPLTESILASVAASFRTLPESVWVRTADALHLVSAKENDLGEIYSNDSHLLAAAPHFGLQGKNVLPAPFAPT